MISEPPPEQHTEASVHNFIDAHIRELKWTAYGLAGLGAFIVLRRIKAATKFSHVADIPPHFTSKNYRLQGHVRKISDCGELYVEHIPIFQLNTFSRRVDSRNLLRVNVAGVSLTPEAVKWLTITTLDKHIWFRLMETKNTLLDCDVTLKQVKTSREKQDMSQFFWPHFLAPWVHRRINV
ncbi:chromosome 3 open reading frame 33 [Elysia marginata]|uniref:Chromosome 3 open reading frame 33 n=1 Tax=Elysia marginata TaxID=1093978 RepID=A0AAV4ELS7_9GAST|nr:chromosome 3 open reading frame 33 [Elysia marginata]